MSYLTKIGMPTHVKIQVTRNGKDFSSILQSYRQSEWTFME